MEGTIIQRWKNRYTRTEVILEGVCVFLILSSLYYLNSIWQSLPARIPTHFNASGQADAWGGKESLLLLPVLTIVLYIILTVTGIFVEYGNTPVRITEENAERQYRVLLSMTVWLKTEVVALMCWLVWKIARISLEGGDTLGTHFLPVVLAGILGTVGWFVFRLYQER
ncbi:DUF1648 domain-containing protein [bacterium]|nr:DUF1648 domain-containing protein [bacterium]